MVPLEGIGVVGVNVRVTGTEDLPESRSENETLNNSEVGQFQQAVDPVFAVHFPTGQAVQADIAVWSLYESFGHGRQNLAKNGLYVPAEHGSHHGGLPQHCVI